MGPRGPLPGAAEGDAMCAAALAGAVWSTLSPSAAMLLPYRASLGLFDMAGRSHRGHIAGPQAQPLADREPVARYEPVRPVSGLSDAGQGSECGKRAQHWYGPSEGDPAACSSVPVALPIAHVEDRSQRSLVEAISVPRA
jgi:hypothetical protein